MQENLQHSNTALPSSKVSGLIKNGIHSNGPQYTLFVTWFNEQIYSEISTYYESSQYVLARHGLLCCGHEKKHDQLNVSISLLVNFFKTTPTLFCFKDYDIYGNTRHDADHRAKTYLYSTCI